MLRHYRMFAAYNRWANTQVYAAAAELSDADFRSNRGAFFGSLHRTLNHLLVADRIWMRRFTGEGDAPSNLATILYRAFPGLRVAREAEDRRIVDWVGGMTDRAFTGRFSYMTTDMRTVSQRLAPALSHLFNHQAHHRGQAHMCLTVLGRPSVPLDLMLFQRSEEGRAYA